MAPTTEKNQDHFPYKTLIWMVFAGFAIFLFKDELKGLLSNAEELTVFGVSIKASEKNADELEEKILDYQDNIASLTTLVDEQQVEVDSLLVIKNELLADLRQCPQTDIKIPILEGKFQKLSDSRNTIDSQSRQLRNKSIIERTVGDQTMN